MDLTTTPPTLLDDIQYRKPTSGGLTHHALEGELRVLEVDRYFEDDVSMRGLRLTKVGCGPRELVVEITADQMPNLRIGDDFPSSSRPLVIYNTEGIYLLDLQPGAEPELWWTPDEIHEALIAEIDGRLPFGRNNARTLESVARAAVQLLALSQNSWLGVVTTDYRFEGIDVSVAYHWVVRMTLDKELEVIFAPDENSYLSGRMRSFPAWGAVWVGESAIPLIDAPADVLRGSTFGRDPSLFLEFFRQFPYLDSEGSVALETSYFKKVPEYADFDRDGAKIGRASCRERV